MSDSSSNSTPSIPSKGTLHTFFPTVKKPATRKPKRLLTAITPPSRKTPLTGRRTPRPIVTTVDGAAQADRLRRFRARGLAVAHPTGARKIRIRAAEPGVRIERDIPLAVEDLWKCSTGGPPYMGSVQAEFRCGICLQLKSHPVSYPCGHGHCYACIRIWLEERWDCPDCRAIITQEPFRIYAEEAHINKKYSDWDTSAVDYSWSGLTFPVLS